MRFHVLRRNRVLVYENMVNRVHLYGLSYGNGGRGGAGRPSHATPDAITQPLELAEGYCNNTRRADVRRRVRRRRPFCDEMSHHLIDHEEPDTRDNKRDDVQVPLLGHI